MSCKSNSVTVWILKFIFEISSSFYTIKKAAIFTPASDVLGQKCKGEEPHG